MTDSFRQECGGGFGEGSKETMSVGREKERKTDDNRRHEERNDVTQDALGQWEDVTRR